MTFIDSVLRLSQSKTHSQHSERFIPKVLFGVPHAAPACCCCCSCWWRCFLGGWWETALGPRSERFVRQTGWFHSLWVSALSLSLCGFLSLQGLGWICFFEKTLICKLNVWWREAPNNFNAYIQTILLCFFFKKWGYWVGILWFSHLQWTFICPHFFFSGGGKSQTVAGYFDFRTAYLLEVPTFLHWVWREPLISTFLVPGVPVMFFQRKIDFISSSFAFNLAEALTSS